MHAPFFIALYKGYYKAEGLDVSIDRGKGSAELVRQLASGVYDMGYPDISVVTDFDSKNPDKGFPVLMMGYEQAPAAIVFLKSSGITTPKQLEGKKLGSAANDATFKLFPIFAQHAGIDRRQGHHSVHRAEAARGASGQARRRRHPWTDFQRHARAQGQGREGGGRGLIPVSETMGSTFTAMGSPPRAPSSRTIPMR